MAALESWLTWLQIALLAPLCAFGLHRGWLAWLCWRSGPVGDSPESGIATWPSVTVQLPIYNERHVAARLLDAAAALDYPRDRLEIQVLDDSSDDTTELIAARLRELPGDLRVAHLRRTSRDGFKAGALAAGLESAQGELLCIFDADFVPPAGFLRATVPHFADPGVGMVQGRWEHLNREFSLLTEMQALLLDGHFAVEHRARAASGRFFNFNGTAGVFRRACIEDAGGWQHDTLTEDLDLSYRAQLAGWRFVYRPDVACPAELPTDVNGFLNQQHRWAKGGVQTARKLLPTVLRRSDLPLGTRVEAAFHLLGNAAFVLLLGLIGVALPLQVLRLANGTEVSPLLAMIEGVPLLISTAGVLFYYGLAESRLRRLDVRRLLELPLVLAVGAGLVVNNTAAVFAGMRRAVGTFRRTPKLDVVRREVRAQGSRYAAARERLPVEVALGLWAAATTVTASCLGLPLTALFHALFAGGLLTIGGAALRQRPRRVDEPLATGAPAQ